MTSVYYDPTEADSDTRLPQSIIAAGRPLGELEHFTGADLLLTPLSLPPLPEVLTAALPHQLALKQHVAAGELVQRKTGRDLSSSIPRLVDIEWRMLQWTTYPRLVFIGDLKYAANGNAVIDGADTGFGYQAVVGALDAWQERGGLVTMLSRDAAFPKWIALRLDKLHGPKEARLTYRAQKQKLLAPDPMLDILTIMPGVGPTRGKALLDHYGSLVRVLVALSDPELGRTCPVEGIGPVTLAKAREPFTLGGTGLRATEQLWVIDHEYVEVIIRALEAEAQRIEENEIGSVDSL